MKRLLLLLMILLLSGSALFSGTGSLLLDAVVFGLDVAAKAGKGKVEVTLPDEEKEISVRRVSMKKMKTTFEEHNFLLLEYEKRLEIYDRLSVPIAWPVVKGITIGFGKGSRLSDLLKEKSAKKAEWYHQMMFSKENQETEISY